MEVSESDRKAIYKHPLFPLLALLFERCEQATHSPDGPFVASLKADIQAFIQHHQQNSAQFESRIGDMPEVDTLMLRAIQILRIHLLELEKVNELCKDFCTRYISCLRMKMQNEQLLHVDSFDPDCGPAPSSHLYGDSSPGGSAAYQGPLGMAPGGRMVPSGGRGYGDDIDMRDRGKMMMMEGSGKGGGMITSSSVIQQHHHQRQDDMIPANNSRVNDRDDMRYERDAGDFNMRHGYSSRTDNGSRLSSDRNPDDDDDDDVDDNDSYHHHGTSLPRHATEALKDWLLKHVIHPYPTEEERQRLAEETGLTSQQINNWFISARHKLSQQIDPGHSSSITAELAYSQQQQGISHQQTNFADSKTAAAESSRQSSASSDRPSSNGMLDNMRAVTSMAANQKHNDSPSPSTTPTSTTTFDSEYDQNVLEQHNKLLQRKSDSLMSNQSALRHHGNNGSPAHGDDPALLN